MIDSENLRTASLYINNQLLSRGLLHDGQNIDFADPGRGSGGLDATMGKVMSVVNDLILRRDRDASARESLSATLRTLRAEQQRHTADQQRQAEALAKAQAQLDASEAAERGLRERLRAAERAAQKTRDEEQRARALVAQTRAACARDVRRRDRAIDDLKKAVVDAARVRGQARGTSCVTAVCVTGEVGAGAGAGAGAGGLPAGATEGQGYSLSLETNEFLTGLASGLSEENEGLRALVRRTVEGLREMSGLDHSGGGGGAVPLNAVAVDGSTVIASAAGNDGNSSGNGNNDHVVLPFIGSSSAATATTTTTMKSAEELSADLDAVLDHLRTILTNPSFVPIEEVEIRDEEIRRLRAGFERLEARWRDAVVLIDGWRRRMGGDSQNGGSGVGDELSSAALMLSPVRIRDEVREADMEMADAAARPRLSCVHEEDEEEEEEEVYSHEQKFMEVDRAREEEEQRQQQQRYQEQERARKQQVVMKKSRSPSPVESLHLVPAPGFEAIEEEGEDDEGSESSSIFEDDIDMEALEAEEPNVQVLHESTWQERPTDSSPLPEPPQLSPLKDCYASGNRGLPSHAVMPQYHHRRGPGDFTTIVEENTWDLAADAAGGIATAAEDEEPPVPPPHTVDYKLRQLQSTPGTKENRPKASELLFSEESTMYDSPLFGRSGEKPSMSDPTRRLFSKPAKLAKESSSSKQQEPEPEQVQVQVQRKTRQTGRPKSSPSPGEREPQSAITTRSQARSAKRKSNPNPSTSEDQQSIRTSPVAATTTAQANNSTTSRSTTSQNSSMKSNATSTTTIITTTSANNSSSGSSNSPGRAPSPSRNNNNNNSNGSNSNAQQQPLINSRLPRRNNPPAAAQQSPLTMETIAAKLAAAEREADAARVRAKLRAARLGKRVGGNGAKAKGSSSGATTVISVTTQAQQQQKQQQQQQEEPSKRQQERKSPVVVIKDLEDVDPVKKSITAAAAAAATTVPPSPSLRRDSNNNNNRNHHDDDEADELASSLGAPHQSGPGSGFGSGEIVIPKRKRDRSRTSAVAAAASRRASRRRSTLSPWELESLIQGSVGVESPAR